MYLVREKKITEYGWTIFISTYMQSTNTSTLNMYINIRKKII